MCVAECCGIDAYDFSPIQIASYITMWQGLPDEKEITTIRNQLAAIKANYGSAGGSSSGVTIEEMNHAFAAAEIDVFTDEISENLEIALKLVVESETLSYKNENHGAQPGSRANDHTCHGSCSEQHAPRHV
jgi:Family of unknown function (DUF6331)